MGLTIRNYSRDNVEALAEFSARSFSDTFGHLYPADDLKKHLEDKCSVAYFVAEEPNFTSLLLYDGDKLVGYSTFGDVKVPLDKEVASDALELQRFYLDASHHGTGAAQQLMDATLNAMKTASEIYLGVWSENERAQKFYTRYGFNHIGNYTYYVGKQEDDEWIMELEHQTLQKLREAS